MPELCGEGKYAPLPGFALHPDSAAQHLDGRGRNGQAQAGPSESPRGRPVRLCEGLEYQLTLFRRDSDSRVRYAKVQMYGVARLTLKFRLNDDVPMFSEFDRIAD